MTRQTFSGHKITERDISAMMMLSDCPEGSGTVNGIMDHNQAHRLLTMRLTAPGVPDRLGDRYVLTALGWSTLRSLPEKPY
jgi:hypothetical protein